MKVSTAILVVCCVCAVTFLSRCSGTSDQDFIKNVRVSLRASDRYDQANTVFLIEFSTVGETVWPGSRSRLVLFVDGKEKGIPSKWGRAVITDHILPNRPRSAAWWMNAPEITDWIGPGEHELQIQFRNVRSNVLKVAVTPEGRVKCVPELDVPHWTKVR
jgi:hypothetical protein